MDVGKVEPSKYEKAFCRAATELGVFRSDKITEYAQIKSILKSMENGSMIVLMQVPIHCLIPRAKFNKEWDKLMRESPVMMARAKAEKRGIIIPSFVRVSVPAFDAVKCDSVTLLKDRAGKTEIKVDELNGFFHYNDVKPSKNGLASQLYADWLRRSLCEKCGISFNEARLEGSAQGLDKDFEFDLTNLAREKEINLGR